MTHVAAASVTPGPLAGPTMAPGAGGRSKKKARLPSNAPGESDPTLPSERRVERTSEEVLQVEQGSLYPALHRLIKRGWISAEEGTSQNNRRAKFYRLTAKGRKQLTIETSKWDKLAGAIARILRPSEQEGK